MDTSIEIAEYFKSEYSNLVAVLCQFYGVSSIQFAEDIVSETFLMAMKSWSHRGVPEFPKAWLRKVAVNKARDAFRRQKTFRDKVLPTIEHSYHEAIEVVFSNEIISDSQLNMMFAICHPSLKIDSQICLALRILCSFNVEEIATALLSNKETINKKIYRAKQKIKTLDDDWNTLTDHDYLLRIDNVLRIIYLIFNEGYYSTISEIDVRHELCWEAMRLCIFLSQQKKLPKQNIHALLGLMCFHASRLDSRINSEGQYILYDAQDRSLWNKDLISKGEEYLSLSAQGGNVSKYHFEAAIAYWHTRDEETKWNNILQLYNKLLTIEYSPIVAMNRTYALARANSTQEALTEALKLELTGNHLYYSLLAQLYHDIGDYNNEVEQLELGIKHAKKQNEINLLRSKLERAKS